MTKPRARKPNDTWNGEPIPRGEARDLKLALGESYSSMTVRIPIQIQRAGKEGPVLFVTAALHGDEINGTGAIRELIQDPSFKLTSGTVILVPVLNLLGFDRFDPLLIFDICDIE